MNMPITRSRRRRPLWMTPFGMESMGDAWMDRLWPEWSRWHGEEYVPSFDFYEKEGKYYLTAEIPGVDKENISISIEQNVVTISGRKESKREEEGANYYIRESSSGSFSRSVRLPGDVEEEKVEATFKDGVLTLVMPHSEAPKSKKIEIKT